MESHLGRYELLQELGRGAMGRVYRAFDPTLHRDLAIKVISSDDSQFRKMLLIEARAAGKLSHPAIVTIYDVGEEGETLYIVMELVKGIPLSARFRSSSRSGPLISLAELLQVLDDVASGLDYAHKQGVVHRDVKPGNIMVNADGAAKIVDFGIAKLTTESNTSLTATVLGTPRYMAPEQFQGHNVTGRVDQFSLAIVAYEGLTGRYPFDEGTNVMSLFQAVMAGLFTSPHLVNTSLPPSTEAVFRRALAVDPDTRYSTCSEFVGALKRALHGQRETIRQPRRKSTPERKQAPVPTPYSSLTSLAEAAPTSFARAIAKTSFFSGDEVRFNKIEESFRFFRDNLQKQYESLARQADMLWKLWAGCVALGFLVLTAGLIAMFLYMSDRKDTVAKGAVTAAATLLVYYIQRLFQQREDHYRRAAEEKNSHLEYGNKWLMVIQTIDAIQDDQERQRQQVYVAKVLTEHLGKSTSQAKVKTIAKKKRR